MRKPPDDFDHTLRVQWVCAALHAFLGKHELTGAPALLSGYRSVLRHPAVAPITQAAFCALSIQTRSTRCTREGAGSNRSAKYCVSCATNPSRNSIILTA